jgi:SAM-dependent MidA family methyltransferase
MSSSPHPDPARGPRVSGGPHGLPDPGPAALARSGRLEALILARIAAAGGWLGFDDYMQLALYAPGLGYYDAAGSKFGPQGDFVTAPEISPLFARALAAQVAEAFGQLPAQVLEFGAGTGALARELLEELQRRGHAARQYFIVEVSADLRARQQQHLAGLPVTWLDALPAAFEGVVVANEVLDVLPVRLFVRTGAGVQERGVVDAGGTLRFGGRPADADLARSVADIEAVVGTLPEGYGSELCPLAAGWIAAVSACLRRGLVLLIDYGFPRAEYYHPQRAMGTLMCHYRQHAHADPLWRPGLNDITAHVDFSACAAAAAAAGLEVAGYTSQARLLMNCGVLDLLAADPSPARAGAVQRLLSEAEMGELVKAMALSRGYAGALLGFARGDRRHRL